MSMPDIKSSSCVLLLLFTSLLWSCNQPAQKHTAETSTAAVATPADVTQEQKEQPGNNSTGTASEKFPRPFERNYNGILDGDKKLYIALSQNTGRVEGSYFLQSAGIDMRLDGDMKGDSIFLYEVDKDDHKNGFIKAQLNGDNLKGTYQTLPDGVPVALQAKTTELNIKPIPATLAGTYSSKNDKQEACDVSLTIYNSNNEAYTYEFKTADDTQTGTVAFTRTDKKDEVYINLLNLAAVKTVADTSKKIQQAAGSNITLTGLYKNRKISFTRLADQTLKLNACSGKDLVLTKN